MRRREMNDQVAYVEQLQGDDGNVVLVNEFNMAPDDVPRAFSSPELQTRSVRYPRAPSRRRTYSRRLPSPAYARASSTCGVR
jgi:hypothetical protein